VRLEADLGSAAWDCAYGHPSARCANSTSARKIRYAPLLVAALDLDEVLRPLERVLAHVRG
jgi:hypothetical protein